MPRKPVQQLQEFVLAPSRLFKGHSHKDPGYDTLFGVFENIEAHVESALDCGAIAVATPGIWKIHVHIVDASEASLPPDDLADGVLQPLMRMDRAQFDAAGTLLDKKHFAARALPDYVSTLAARWRFDASGLVRALDDCAHAGELIELPVPSAMTRNASATRSARWAVRMSFHDTVVATDIDDGGKFSRLDLVRLSYPSYLLVAMFASTIRWKGDRRLLLRSRPVTDILFGNDRCVLLLDSRPGVRFERVPVERPGATATVEFRFEWRLDLGDAHLRGRLGF